MRAGRAGIAIALTVLAALVIVPWGTAPRSAAQSRSEAVHQRQLVVSAPWGEERVLVMFPRLPGAIEHPAHRRWAVLVALHGQGEARRGPARGFLGWSVDYRLTEAFGALGRGRLEERDYGGFVRADHLAAVNAGLRRRRFEGLMVVCPYTPDLMPEMPGSDRITEYASWISGPMLDAVRGAFPGAARGRDATGIDGVSLGGMLSLEIGLRHPEAFGSVGALQPAIRGREEAIAAIARPDGAQRIRLLTSDDDPFRLPTRALSEQLRARQVAHDLTIVPGPHDYAFNRGPGGLEMLLFHERALAHEALPIPQ